MIQNQGEFIRSTAPASAPFPHDPPHQSGRVISNPERPPPHFREGSIRQFPAPDGRFAVPCNAPSGGIRRGDFHSDPVTTLGQWHPENFMGIPSRGGPGPYSYGTTPVPLTARRGGFIGTMPRGTRNPSNHISNDARRQPDMQTGRMPPHNQGIPGQYGPPPPMWSTESMQTPNQFLSQTQYAAQGPGPYWSGHNYPSRHPGIGQPAPQALPLPVYHQQVAPIGRMANDRGPVAVGQTSPLAPPRGQLLYDHSADTQQPVHANMSNAEQRQRQQGSEPQPKAGQTLQTGEHCRIWVGNLPTGFITKAAVMELLQPCRGLLDVTEPTAKRIFGRSFYTKFVFATYVNPCSNEASICDH